MCDDCKAVVSALRSQRVIKGQGRKEVGKLSSSLVHLPLNFCVMPLSVNGLKAVLCPACLQLIMCFIKCFDNCCYSPLRKVMYLCYLQSLSVNAVGRSCCQRASLCASGKLGVL